jgi:hypothetical protein
VKAPVLAVVAPTVPLILMLAVPVKFVTVPEAGVPKIGVTRVGDVDITTLPVPVMALLTRAFEPLVKTACEAVRAVKIGAAFMVATPVLSAKTIDAVPSLALMLVTSRLVVSTVVALITGMLAYVIASTTFVPSQYKAVILPAGTEIPLPPEVFRVTAKPPVVLFLIKYSLEAAGQITFRAAVSAPVIFRNMLRASSVAPLRFVSV